MAGQKWGGEKGVWAIFSQVQGAAIGDIRIGSDRVAAIIGGALVDAQLLAALQLRMRGEENSRAFLREARSGFLDSNNARIQLGYLLQMYGVETRLDLEKIGEIRNKFAHRLEPLSFDQPPISTLCAALTAPNRMTFPDDMFSPMGTKPDHPTRFSSLRDRFVASIQLLMCEIFYDRQTHDPFSCRLTTFTPKKPTAVRRRASADRSARSSPDHPQSADHVPPKRPRRRPSSPG